jgi:hypothetical protein
MKEPEPSEKTLNQRSQCFPLPACLTAMALALSVTQGRAQYDRIITPDEMVFQGWGANLQWSAVGAFPGDGQGGYPWTPNWGATPSATVIIPLGGLPAGFNVYNIYEWIPEVNSESYNIVDVLPPIPGIGTQQLIIPQNDQGGWVELELLLPSGPDGYDVWINGSDNPYLQIHYLGFENSPESFDAFRVVQVGVPEPSAFALGLLGGCALFAGSSRRAKTNANRRQGRLSHQQCPRRHLLTPARRPSPGTGRAGLQA